MFATNVNQSDLLKSLNLQIDPNKVVFELVCDKLKLLSNNKLQKLKNDISLSTNFLYKLQRKYSIDVMEKFFVMYIKNTNYSLDFLNSYSHSYIVSKNNNSNLLASQNIYEFNNIKNEIVRYLYYDYLIDMSVTSCRFLGNYFF